ncbi:MULTISPECIES: sugar ABC transporter permease [unclassified Chelatococcus]|uniref:carbohydrate ABC transporter permease n=1 Tax=unclassified Chelatococcus TaxID=2638111 RepID=UPI0020BF1BD7|nr:MULTISPECIES: sugar ABC transporter permease [unclassified Chelatococcus]MCO5074731.1 sugar ABC transporter permease [Chelatococcus sp.]
MDANNNVAAFLFLSPWLIGMICLTLGPILASFYLSLTSYDMFSAPQWIGFDNYIKMAFEDSRYYQSLKVTFSYVFLSVPLKLAFALGIAMLLNRGLRGLGFYRSVFYLPSLLGGSVAVAIMWRQVFSYDGIINQVLLKFGIDGPSWITSTDYALYTLVALAIWQFGSPMVIFLAGLKQIPQDIYDAAEVDGAGPIRKFVSITIPMLTPIIFFNFVMQIIGAFQAFTPAYIISGGKGGPADATLFYTLYLYEQAFTNFQMGYASAMAWVLVGIIGTATAASFLSARYWVHYGDER